VDVQRQLSKFSSISWREQLNLQWGDDDRRSIIISAFYRPPSLQDMTYTEKIRNDFVHLKTLATHNSLWIAGDFNLPDINSIVRKDTAMKSFNFVCTSVRSTSIFVDFHKYILRFVCLILLILMLVSTKTMSWSLIPGKFGKPTTRKTEIGSENSEAQKTARKAYNNYIHDIISPDQTIIFLTSVVIQG
jgi:hypothetical protein